MSEKIIEAYITKYALSEGRISKERVRICGNGDMVAGYGEQVSVHYHGEGKEWHRTFESALKRANSERDKAIASAERKIEKLRNLNFEEAT